MMRRESPDAACSGLYSKTLDAASGEYWRRITPATAMVIDIVVQCRWPQNTTFS